MRSEAERSSPRAERRQYHCDLLKGGFQTVQGGVAPGSESGVAGLATKCLDLLSMTMLAIPNQGMNMSVGDAEVQALPVSASLPFSQHNLLLDYFLNLGYNRHCIH